MEQKQKGSIFGQDYEYGLGDYFQFMAWYLVLALLVWQLGWIYGILANIVFSYVAGFILKSTLGLEMMTGNDEFFFLDDFRNRMNIVAF